MPVSKSAKKKMRKDLKRTVHNERIREKIKKLLKQVRRERKPELLSAAYKALDKAAKTHLIHRNKASRLKSRLARLVSSSPQNT